MSIIRIATIILSTMLVACSGLQQRASLYDQFGQRDGLGAVVDGLIVRIKANTKIMPLFENTDFSLFRERLTDFLCIKIEGPCSYDGEEMIDVHTGMGITEAEFNDLVEDMIDVMEARRIPRGAQNELLARLVPTRKDIIYQ